MHYCTTCITNITYITCITYIITLLALHTLSHYTSSEHITITHPHIHTHMWDLVEMSFSRMAECHVHMGGRYIWSMKEARTKQVLAPNCERCHWRCTVISPRKLNHCCLNSAPFQAMIETKDLSQFSFGRVHAGIWQCLLARI